MTQEALAQEAGVTVGHMSMIERGHSNPTWGTVRGISSALNTSIAEVAKLSSKLEGES